MLMRGYLLFMALGLCLAHPCSAEPIVTPEVQALQATVLELTSNWISWRTRAIALQAQVNALGVELKEARTSTPPPRAANGLIQKQ